MTDDHGTKVAVVGELERNGWTWEYANDGTIRTCCPFHDDSNPSAVIDPENGNFRCFTAGCNASGDLVKFLARLLKSTRGVIVADLENRYGITHDKTIAVERIERYHERIWTAKPLLVELARRGVGPESVRRWRLGEDRGRITIPIPNPAGAYVNVRKYLPGAPDKEKFKNDRGRSALRLYPYEQLQHEYILVCGGEIKALAAIERVEAYGIGCVSATGGEGSWLPAFNEKLRGKTVLICMDIDAAGQKAAEKLANILYRVAKSVGIVRLPLDPDKYPKGDLNDYLAQPGADLLALLGDVDAFEPSAAGPLSYDPDEPAEPASLARACTAESAMKRLEVGAVVSAISQAPYVIPASFNVACTRSTEFCGLCEVYAKEPSHVYQISPEAPEVLEMVSAPKAAQQEALMSVAGIPDRCRVCSFTAQSWHNVEDVRISPRLEIGSRAEEREMLPAVVVGSNVELNETYTMRCRMHPHPKTQQSTLVVSAAEVAEDALSSYEVGDPERLRVFQGNPIDVLPRLYDDLEANVTRIFQRRDVHLLVDLCYHSPLFIPFDGRTVKGWVEVLIVGDSSQGKSETTSNLQRHYQTGATVECRNASVAGLLGGLEQIGGKWFVKWGIIPTHDKRLVVMEELKGARQDVISRLTDMRSKGIAEIPKIEKRRTYARTRLVAVSNPRTDMPMSSYNFGLETIPELIGGLEDIRRFDAAMVVAEADVDAATLNKLAADRPQVPHTFTSDLCRDLVLWAWTREPDQIHFVDGAERLILDKTVEMTKIYTEAVPLVDKGSMRNKIARLACALAARVFSTDDGERLLVKPEHVEYVCGFLDHIYSGSAMAYRSFSQALEASRRLRDPEAVKSSIESSPFPRDLCDHILHATEISSRDIQDWCGWDRDASAELVSLLVRKRAMVRDGWCYRKTPDFIVLLKEMLSSDGMQGRPGYITEGAEF